MALIILGKLLSSLSDRNVVASCFNEHMIKKIVKIRAKSRDVAPAPFMRKFHLVKCKRKIMTLLTFLQNFVQKFKVD